METPQSRYARSGADEPPSNSRFLTGAFSKSRLPKIRQSWQSMPLGPTSGCM